MFQPQISAVSSSELWISDISLFYYNYVKIEHNYLGIMTLNKPKARVTDGKPWSGFCSALETSLCLEEQLKPTELLK